MLGPVPLHTQERGNHGLNAIGRLRQGVSLAQAQAEIDTLTRGFLQQFPNNYDDKFGLTLVPAPVEVFGVHMFFVLDPDGQGIEMCEYVAGGPAWGGAYR